MGWMDSAQAKYLAEEYKKTHPEEAPAKLDSEEKALRAYKRERASVLPDRKKLRQIEEHAAANGWDSIDTYKRGADERRAQYERNAREQATRITTPEEAAAASDKALRYGDRRLYNAINETARTKGWTNMTKPKSIEEYAAEINTALNAVISDHDAISRPWRESLSGRKVTPEYVAEQTGQALAANRSRVEDVLSGVKTHLNEAQATFDQAYRDLTTFSGDTNEQLLAEIRAGKAWDRVRRELDAIDPERLSTDTLNRISSADQATLGTLIQELPSYLASRGLAEANTIVRHGVGARPELADAQARIAKAQRLHDVTIHNVKNMNSRLDTITHNDTTHADVAYVDPTSIKY